MDFENRSSTPASAVCRDGIAVHRSSILFDGGFIRSGSQSSSGRGSCESIQRSSGKYPEAGFKVGLSIDFQTIVADIRLEHRVSVGQVLGPHQQRYSANKRQVGQRSTSKVLLLYHRFNSGGG
jgi:hypothetical protein